MKKNQSFFDRAAEFIVKPPAQVVMMVISSGFAFFLAKMAIDLHIPLEKHPDIRSITPALIKEWGGDPTIVDVGLYIQSWQKFDIVANDFIFDGILWFQFDPALISLDTIDKFSFEKGEILRKSEPSTRLIDGKLFAEYKVRLRFTTELIHRFFPIDDHRIYIVLVNTFVSPGEVVFKVFKSTFSVSPNILIPDWIQIDHEAQSGYGQESIDKFDTRKTVRYPKVVFSLDFIRSGVSLILLILIPIFLIFFISLFSLALDPKDNTGGIMALSTSALTSLIAYRFVIQAMAPKVGYFLLSDHIFTLFLALSFINFIVAVILMWYGRLTPFLIKMRGLLFILFHITFLCAWSYLLFLWIR